MTLSIFPANFVLSHIFLKEYLATCATGLHEVNFENSQAAN